MSGEQQTSADVWLLDGPQATVTEGRSVQTRTHNQVTAYITVRDYYQALATAIGATQGGQHDFVLFADWYFDMTTPLDPPVNGQATIGDLLTVQSKQGVSVRALIWAHPDGSNRSAAQWFSHLTHGGAIHDDRVLLTGAHHQKFAVVQGTAGAVAFCGGMDIEAKRLADGPDKQPWHDIQVQIKGPAAIDVWQTFCDRWTEQANIALGEKDVATPVYPTGPDLSGVGQSVQILHTYGNGSRHLGLSINKNPAEASIYGPFTAQKKTYAFAPTGERTILHLLIKAIRAARSSIYLEDQYAIESEAIDGEPSLTAELAKTLAKPSFQGMIILTNGVGTIQQDLCQVNYRWSRFWSQLNALVPGKVSVWAYKGGPSSPYWMHSKTWIFDDTLAVVGSANCNRRGYCHDSEIAAAILDPAAAENLPFAQDLRVRLWLKHLNSLGGHITQNDVIDFAAGMKYWVEGNSTDLKRLTMSIPDSSQPDRSFGDNAFGTPPVDSLLALFRLCKNQVPVLTGLQWRDVEWDYVIDPDGA